MMLDSGILDIYRVDAVRGSVSPTDGLTAVYHNWFGVLRHDAARGEDSGDTTVRVRIHGTEIRLNDIAHAFGRYWRVSRVFEGVDDDTGLPVCDLTLETGERHFQRMRLIPRQVLPSATAALASMPDMERAREIWATAGNVSGADYFTAEAAGHSLSLRVSAYVIDYDAEPYVEYDSKLYEVTRTETHGPVTDLFCEAVEAWRE